MASALVVNASPLILFARIDRLDLLTSLASSLVVPQAVWSEIQAGSGRDGTAGKVEKIPSIRVEDRPVPERVRLWDLGAGGQSGRVEPRRARRRVAGGPPVFA